MLLKLCVGIQKPRGVAGPTPAIHMSSWGARIGKWGPQGKERAQCHQLQEEGLFQKSVFQKGCHISCFIKARR